MPSNIKLRYSTGKASRDVEFRKKKGKCKEGENDLDDDKLKENRLATLDIFAGCGGLSEGLQQSGVISSLSIIYQEVILPIFSEWN